MARIGGIDGQSLGRTIKRVAIAVVVLVATLWIGCASTTRVDAGHVGVKVKMTGSERGVQMTPLTAGWHLFNPVTEQIILFPTSVQNIVWSNSQHEGRPHDESITFSSKEGVNINADVGLSFHVVPALAPKLYDKFRLNDMNVLANGYMRNAVREAFNDVASKMEVQAIYGEKKTEMLFAVVEKCKALLGPDGMNIDQLTINGTLRLPESVMTAINRVIEQNQAVIQSKARVAQVEAEANQMITQAHGAAEAARRKAQGDADAVLIRARSEAQANEIIRLSMTPTMMQYRALDRWDGKLPVYQATANLPMLTFDVGKELGGLTEPERQKRLKDLLEQKKEAPQPPEQKPR
jgi:regulator of protease activity HflC (stomatin/prohibitin superfamily)